MNGATAELCATSTSVPKRTVRITSGINQNFLLEPRNRKSSHMMDILSFMVLPYDTPQKNYCTLLHKCGLTDVKNASEYNPSVLAKFR